MKKAGILLIIVVVVALGLILFERELVQINPQTSLPQHSQKHAELKKVLYINSYHIGYEWSDGVYNSILSTYNIVKKVDGSLDTAKSPVVFRSFEMDTKRNPSDSAINAAVKNVRELIDSWKPDVVIASDDAAAKYVISPYYKDTDIPVIFCGINWSAQEYGFPSSNVTGMVSVHLIDAILERLRTYAKGDRIGFIRGDNITSRKDAQTYESYFHIKLDKRLVKTFAEWKQEYINLQKQSDMILIGNASSIEGWNAEEALDIINTYTEIPSASNDTWMRYYALFTIPNSPTEQGEWVAQKALEVAQGKPISSIKMTTNKKSMLFINMRLAKKLGIKFSMEDLQHANIFNADKSKIMYINSYHKGYPWSDDIEKGLFMGLGLPAGSSDTVSNNKIALKIIRMDSKIHNGPEEIVKSAQHAKKIIEEWNPEIIISSDDNAFKHVIKPYFFNSSIPILYCGINWDASIYGLPKSNIKGMTEVAPMQKNLEIIGEYVPIKKIGFLSPQTYSERRSVEALTKVCGIHFDQGAYVATFQEWKDAFLLLQDKVDCIFLPQALGTKGWNAAQAKAFVRQNIKVPTFSAQKDMFDYTVIGMVKVPEEHGWWCAQAAKKILNGTSITNIDSVFSKRFSLYVNTELAQKIGIKIPVETLEKSNIIK